jgi:hypothetical protein
MRLPNFMVCATDAGGAAVTAPVASLARDQGWRVTIFSGTGTKDSFSQWGFDSLLVNEDPASQVEVLAPDVILIGTTRYPSPERSITRLARGFEIPTVAVLDDWSNYRVRFLDEGSSLCLPDLVCCPDAVALLEMSAECLDEKRLLITGHPALAAAADKMALFFSSPPPRPQFFPSDGRPVVLFLSETHSTDFGSQPGEHGPLGPFLGYCEYSVRAELAKVTSSFYVIEKRHPADRRSLPFPTDAAPGRWITAPAHPLWEVIWHADAVVGMKSVALIESALLARPTVSFQPGLIGPDPCTASRLGVVSRLGNIEMLLTWLNDALGLAPVGLTRPYFADASAAANVLEAVRGLLENK